MRTRSCRSPWKATTLSLALCAVTSGCAQREYAAVVITYEAPAASGDWNLIALPRRQVEQAFTNFSAANGYKCRAHIKRVEEYTCRGPRDLHLTFQPTMNKPEFVAKFTWVDLAGRTGEEFEGHVQRFSEHFAASAGVVKVTVSTGQP